jgi:hypothetical protein
MGLIPFFLGVLILLPVPRALAHRCTGDCDFDDQVKVSELVVGLRIAVGELPLDACPQLDPDGSGTVSINELLVAVNNAFTYCGHLFPPTPRPSIAEQVPPRRRR